MICISISQSETILSSDMIQPANLYITWPTTDGLSSDIHADTHTAQSIDEGMHAQQIDQPTSDRLSYDMYINQPIRDNLSSDIRANQPIREIYVYQPALQRQSDVLTTHANQATRETILSSAMHSQRRPEVLTCPSISQRLTTF